MPDSVRSRHPPVYWVFATTTATNETAIAASAIHTKGRFLENAIGIGPVRHSKRTKTALASSEIAATPQLTAVI